MTDIKHIPIAEFRKHGYLHEINRLLLHPLGLAMEARSSLDPGCLAFLPTPAVDELVRLLREVIASRGAMNVHAAKDILGAIERGEWLNGGDEVLGNVWDRREDPEGIYYGDDLLDASKAAAVAVTMFARRDARRERLGYVVQPVETEAPTLTTTYLNPAERIRG